MKARDLRLEIREKHRVIQMVQQKPYTMVRIIHGQFQAYGFSKWNPNDKGKKGLEYDAALGILKATNKAIDNMVGQIERQAEFEAVRRLEVRCTL